MNKNEKIYLKNELKELYNKMKEITEKYNKENAYGKCALSIQKDKAESIYYHFWMVCNDLDIIDINDEEL